jgi:hypothetical protein
MRVAVIAAAAFLCGCPPSGDDAGRDGGVNDAGPGDAGPNDAGPALPDAGPDGADRGEACSGEADCSPGLACDGVCGREACGNDRECDEGFVCDVFAFVCMPFRECESTVACPRGFFCLGTTGNPAQCSECVDDNGCPDPLVCAVVDNLGRCEPPLNRHGVCEREGVSHGCAPGLSCIEECLDCPTPELSCSVSCNDPGDCDVDEECIDSVCRFP